VASVDVASVISEHEWKKYWLGLSGLVKERVENPSILRLPVGNVVAVREGKGYKVGGRWWMATPGYVLKEHVEKLHKLVSVMAGWRLYVSPKELAVEKWSAGWVEEYYKFSDSPVMRVVLPGMVRVEMRIENVDLAEESLKKYKDIPVCPACTLEQYEDERCRSVFDQTMRYFIHYHLYGEVIEEE
jgi:hypothetical protein